jgi:hypothetical protein
LLLLGDDVIDDGVNLLLLLLENEKDIVVVKLLLLQEVQDFVQSLFNWILKKKKKRLFSKWREKTEIIIRRSHWRCCAQTLPIMINLFLIWYSHDPNRHNDFSAIKKE